MNSNILELIKISLSKIKEESLHFSVVAILLIITFPNNKFYILGVYLFGLIIYTIINVLKLKNLKVNNRFLENFESHLSTKEDWESRIVDDLEVYFYVNDNNYKIEQSPEMVKEWTARESWMENFPDSSIVEYKVYLKHGESKIKEFTFLSCDGGRYFIPLPKKKLIDSGDENRRPEYEYSWDIHSTEYKVGQIIGSFYREENLEQVARFCGIRLLD